MTIPTREMHIAHKRDTGEMGGRGQGCGRVIDLHLPTGREGGRRTRWTLGATPPSTRCRPAHLYGQDQESGCSSHPPRVCSSRFLKVWMWRARRSPRFLIFYVSGEKSIYFRILFLLYPVCAATFSTVTMFLMPVCRDCIVG